MADHRLQTLNRAYYLGEYDFSEYRKLRALLIDEITQIKKLEDIPLDNTDSPTLNIRREEVLNIPQPPLSEADAHKSARGPSVLQFLWVSIAILLFVYMYTASID